MTSPVLRFAELSQAYCRWAEGDPDPSTDLQTALRLLPELYAAALNLPDTEPGDRVAERMLEKSKAVFRRFGSLPFQYYEEIFDPFEDTPVSPVTGDICDDLADIYLDLKEGLDLYQQGEVDTAVFSWRITFGFHWGRHLTGALNALHCFVTKS